MKVKYFMITIKVIPMHFMKPEDKENAKNEIYLLKVLVGPTIINYYESFEENESINIIMEYAEGN
jgi:NIMA (never in mitosis gene a)-related kinase